LKERQKMKTKIELICRIIGLACGLILAVPNLYPAIAPLQLVAFMPIIYFAARGIKNSAMLAAGMYMGLSYTLIQAFVLRLPVPMTLILLAEMTTVLAVFAWGCSKLVNKSGIIGAFAVGALIVILDWASFTFVPIWGTAQSLGRCWSSYPALIAFVQFTGITGIVFVLVTSQVLAVNFIVHSKGRKNIALTAAIIIFVFVAADFAARLNQPIAKIKVAAIGWTLYDSAKYGEVYSPRGYEALFAEPVMEAAKNGAKLIVSPEFAFQFGGNTRQEWLEKFSRLASANNVFLVIGYFDTSKEENQLLFMSDKGEVVGEYTKTYLTPFEDYHKGTGKLLTVEVNSIKVGSMICHDDNFTHLSREYGRREVAIVAVPTLDWLQVRSAHLQNSIHRAIESRYAVVRACLNGISTIISPSGDILAIKDHFKEGPGVIIAEIPIYKQQTLFSKLGHWPVTVSVIFLIYQLLNRKKNIMLF
jgi:apolipoprotein N-acyltransferase